MKRGFAERWGGVRWLIAIVVVVVTGALVAGQATGVLGGPSASAARGAGHASRKPQAQDIAGRLLNSAYSAVNRADKECTFGTPPAPLPVTLNDAAPNPGLLASVGALRRTPTPAELRLVRSGGYSVGSMTTLYRRYARIVVGSTGLKAKITVGIGQQYRPPLLYDPRCVRAVKKALAPHLSHQPPAVRKAVAGLLHVIPIPAGPTEQLNLMVGAGGTELPLGLKRFRSQGLFLSAGSGGPLPPGLGGAHGKQSYRPKHPHATFAGLVPDGVATVTITLPQRMARGLYAPTAIYPSAYTATARVHQNMAFFTSVPRDAPDVRGTMIWRGAHGQLLRVIKPSS